MNSSRRFDVEFFEPVLEFIEFEIPEDEQKMSKNLAPKFDEDIKELVPDFDSEAVRQFALDEGIPQEFLDIIMDANVVKFVDDYRRLKQGISKGTAKRKNTPAKKAPLKKAKTTSRKKQDAASAAKARAMNPDSSSEDQMDFLRGLAERSLNL